MTHRYELLRFCPACGAPYDAGSFDPGAVKYLCRGCGFDSYQNSVPSATAVVPSADDPRRVLLIVRATPPGIGQLALPGGILRYGEDPAEGAAREAEEETTVPVRVERLLCATLVDYAYRGARLSMLELAYLMRPVRHDLPSGGTGEATRVDFCNLDDVFRDPARLAFPEQERPLREYDSWLRSLPSR